MLIVIIILGLVGLGLVVVVHEFGHFLAARAVGVEVEAFSIGWGPRLAGFKRGPTEWRLSAFPIGGYCRMKGEESFRKALAEGASEMPRESGSFYAASPWRRIAISVSGPLANVLLALVIFIVASTISYSTPTYPNRIVLLSEYNLGSPRLASYPADKAGLKSGDRIVEADGKTVNDFSDLLDRITLSANRPIALKVERGGQLFSLSVTPMLDKNTGTGLIGVSYWAESVVGTVAEGSAASIAGIEPGDRITAIDSQEVHHAIQAFSILNSVKPERATISIERAGERKDLVAVLNWSSQGQSNLGISFQTQTHRVQGAASLAQALEEGLDQTWSTFGMTIKGLASLFQGVDLFKALSGPARITYYIGQSATTGIRTSSSGGLAVPLDFLGFLSIGLFIMNLLPIPALDGGQVVMFLVEGVRKASLKPITVYRYQFIGATFILALFVIATIGDLLFFVNK